MVDRGTQVSALTDGDLDPASRSLNAALRTSFNLLRLMMIVLVVAFIFSGMFKVNEGEVVIRTRFGKILGNPGEEVLRPGGPYFSLPRPMDEQVRVPTTVQRVTLDREFWFETTPDQATRTLDELMTLASRNLAPGRDGFLLTADQNVVHAKWTVNYQIPPERAGDFVRQVGSIDAAERLVRLASESAAVHVVAMTLADDFVRGQVDRSAVRAAVQRTLDEMNSGIVATEVLLSVPTAPMSVRPAFLEVSQAETEKAQKIEAAQRDASKTLNDVAGSGHRALLVALEQYERATALSDSKSLAAADAIVTSLLDGNPVSDVVVANPDLGAAMNVAQVQLSGGERVGGRVSEVINEARTYRTQISAQVNAEANRFSRLLPIYKTSPLVTLQRLWSEARQEIMSNPNIETIYLPDDAGKTLILEVNRDPQVKRRREELLYQQKMQSQQTPAATASPAAPQSMPQTR